MQPGLFLSSMQFAQRLSPFVSTPFTTLARRITRPIAQIFLSFKAAL